MHHIIRFYTFIFLLITVREKGHSTWIYFLQVFFIYLFASLVNFYEVQFHSRLLSVATNQLTIKLCAMYNLLKHQGVKKFLHTEMPSLGTSLLISEAMFKFGSFILECSAFLVTWYAFSFVFDQVMSWRKESLGQLHCIFLNAICINRIFQNKPIVLDKPVEYISS